MRVLLWQPRWARCFNSTNIGTGSCLPQERNNCDSLQCIEAVRCVLALCSSRCRARGPCLLCVELSNRERHQLQSISRRSGALRAEVKRREQRQRPCSRAEGAEAFSSLDVTKSNLRGTQEVRRSALIEDYGRSTRRYDSSLLLHTSTIPVSYPSNAQNFTQLQNYWNTSFPSDIRQIGLQHVRRLHNRRAHCTNKHGPLPHLCRP
jgi:hypothetical protein